MRQRRHPNPIQVGDRVVVTGGQLSGLAGTVLARESAGKLLIDIDVDLRGVLVRTHFRQVRLEEQARAATGKARRRP
jgi:hypothetical protein